MRVRAVVAILILSLTNLSFGKDWIQFSVTNPAASTLAGYAIPLTLNENFPFASSTSDGSDIQVFDGSRSVQFASYVQNWDQAGSSGTVWFRMPYLPANSSSNLWIHYAKSGSFNPRVLPWGPYIRSGANPILFANRGTHTNLLAENVVYDPDTAHWWMVMGDNASVSIDLAYSDDPTDAAAWTWWGTIVTGENGNGPCLVKDGSTWYLFQDHYKEIAYRSSESITGSYSAPITVLNKGAPGSWESFRVTEPYVFKRAKNDWMLLYMGDSRLGGNPTEQVGYATATNITGPYTKYSGNPFISFGAPGAYDAGTAADPWALQVDSTWYIGYSISPTYMPPWKTGFACTTDWTNVTKLGQLFVTGGGWDAGNAFRGAALSVSNTFLLPYTSASYKVGLSTARAVPNDPNRVFLWQDDFSGSSLDPNYWQTSSPGSQFRINDGILTMSCSSTFIEINGPSVGQDYIVEFYARHRTHGTLNRIMELGLGVPNQTCIRLDDDYTDTKNWEGRTRTTDETVTDLHVTADSDWHTFALARTNGTAMWRVGSSPWTVADGTNVDSSSFLGVLLLAYGNGDVVDVDWVRIRRFVSPEPTALLGPTVLVPPSIISEPTNQAVATGGSASFQVSADGSIPLSYQWMANGKPVAGGTSSALVLNNVQVRQAGNYSVIVKNSVGTAISAVAVLTVGTPPAITQQPSSLEVIKGQDATFTVSSTGDSPLIYQWRFNGSPISGATGTSYSLVGATASNAGAYDSVVSNAYGAVTSAVAQLTVLLPPSIITQPTNQTVSPGANASFAASASGTPPLTYQWSLNGSGIPGATLDTLSFTNIQPAQAGAYTLLVTNAAGSITSAVAYLKVLVSPMLVNPSIIGNDVSVQISTQTGLSYLLEYKNKLQDGTWTSASSWTSGSGGALILQDTNSFTGSRFYRVRCR